MKIHFNSNRSHKAIATRRMSFAKQEHELTPREQAAFGTLRKDKPSDAATIQSLGFPSDYLNDEPVFSPKNVVINTWRTYLDAFFHLPHN